MDWIPERKKGNWFFTKHPYIRNYGEWDKKSRVGCFHRGKKRGLNTLSDFLALGRCKHWQSWKAENARRIIFSKETLQTHLHKCMWRMLRSAEPNPKSLQCPWCWNKYLRSARPALWNLLWDDKGRFAPRRINFCCRCYVEGREVPNAEFITTKEASQTAPPNWTNPGL